MRVFYSGKNTKVTAPWLRPRLGSRLVLLHGGIFERLWCQKFDDQNRFGLGQLLGVNTNDAHLAHHIWSVMRR